MSTSAAPTYDSSLVIDYPARDMTITVKAEMPCSLLQQILRQEGQTLPIDAASEQTTVGELVLQDHCGPRQFGYGTLRDYVIGVAAVDGFERLFHAGGRVVKNVAGYDLCKLLIGSNGTLAIITQVTLKLRPKPETSALVGLTFESVKQVEALLARLMSSATRPVAIDVLNPQATLNSLPRSPSQTFLLCVGYEGADREVRWQIETMLAEARAFEPRSAKTLIGSGAEPAWTELTDFAISGEMPTARSPLTFKASLLPSKTMEFLQLATESGISAKAHAGNGIVLGHLPSRVTTSAQAEPVLQPLSVLASSCRGSMSMLRVSSDWPIAMRRAGSSAGHDWSERIQRQLDPLGLFRE
ncbi:MAG TPA: hypothetical protein DCR20_08550 [Planctomycetaceae bacterium]|nr:hypothetical protein [Planctomycetaceae bacterium]